MRAGLFAQGWSRPRLGSSHDAVASPKPDAVKTQNLEKAAPAAYKYQVVWAGLVGSAATAEGLVLVASSVSDLDKASDIAVVLLLGLHQCGAIPELPLQVLPSEGWRWLWLARAACVVPLCVADLQEPAT